MSLCLATALAPAPAFADEGMYTFDNFPAAKVKAKYGVSVTPQWLDRVRLATARISGCTAVFVSADGLMITNHHCAESCMEQNSTKERSYVEDGFVAPDRSRELACKAQVADVLIAMEDITAKVAKRTGSLDDKRANDERRKLLTDLESECEAAAAADPKLGRLRCESVTLYEGGQYFLYKYKRYSDVRAVFVPEAAVAAFGGDPDNFQFPRWSFDIAILRAWEDGKPARTPNHLSIDFAGPKPGDAVFVSGHPGKTSRLFTVGELDTVRTTTLPFTLLRGYELRGRYLQFAKESATNARITAPSVNRLENLMKVRRRQLDALLEGPLMAEKRRREAELRSRVKADKALHARTGDPWREIDAAEARMRQMFYPYTFIEEGSGFDSQLYRWAKTLVRGTDERDKPNNRAAARVHGHAPRARRAAAADAGTRLSRSGTVDDDLRPRAHARMARAGCANREAAAGEGVARRAGRAPRREEQSRGRRGAAHAVEGRPRRRAGLPGSADPAGARPGIAGAAAAHGF